MHAGETFVFYALPATKSTSTRLWLEQDFGAIKITQNHECIFREEDEGKFKFSVTRDPRDRAVSLWRRFNDRHNGPVWKTLLGRDFPEHFDEMFEIILARDEWCPPPHKAHLKPHTEVLGDYPSDLVIFDYDNTPDIYETMPFVDEVVDFPHRNFCDWRPGLKWDDLRTSDSLNLVMEWAGDDFGLWEAAL